MEGLLAKRDEMAAQIQALQSGIFHIDATLKLLGHDGGPGGKRERLFANGELIALIGEAERTGLETPVPIALHIMKSKGMDPADAALKKRMVWKVKECRKRLNRREKE